MLFTVGADASEIEGVARNCEMGPTLDLLFGLDKIEEGAGLQVKQSAALLAENMMMALQSAFKPVGCIG